MIKIAIKTNSENYQDGRFEEIAHILNEASELVFNGFGSETEILLSSNGNEVGALLMNAPMLTFEPKALSEVRKYDHMMLSLETRGDAFIGEGKYSECSRIIKEAAGKVRGCYMDFELRDINEEVVGKVENCLAVKPAPTKKKITKSMGI